MHDEDVFTDIDGDIRTFDECWDDAGRVIKGYWTPFTALAWVATRDDRFVSAMQVFETVNHANRGSNHSAASWLVLSRRVEEHSGRRLDEAVLELREALEAGRLPGAIASSDHGDLIEVTRPMWTRWRRTFPNHGVSLIPGMVDFQFPSEEVQSAFPVSNVPLAPTAVDPALTERMLADWADDAATRDVTITDARNDAVSAMGALAPPAYECRSLLRAARQRQGKETRSGRPRGSKSFAKARS